MAQALLNQLYGDKFEAHCADLRPGPTDPLVVQVLAEYSIDVSHHEA